MSPFLYPVTFMKKLLVLLSIFSFSLYAAEEKPMEAIEDQTLTINLKDPVFTHGVISTDKGGVISTPDLRIQAQKIEYTNKIENGVTIRKIVAEGDLLLEYGSRVFVGKKLEYDFVHKTGVVWEGTTSTDYWFIGGEKIELQPDGSFFATNAFLTTVEGQNPWWELKSSQIDISNKSLLKAKNIKFKFFKIPLLWLPSFKFDLKKIKDFPIRYKFIWDQALKQKISLRYELYSTETFQLFGRFDYQFKYGPGAAIETDYQSLDERTVFQTKSYGALNKIVPDEPAKGYRFQGLYTTHSKNEKTYAHLSYDKLSDDKMPQIFKSDDFEVNTQKRTIFWVTHHEQDYFGRFSLQPRINKFQSINQQLPYITAGLRPFTLGSSGIISDNWFSAGYLNYVYGTALKKHLGSTNSGRFETSNTLSRPFGAGPTTLTPSVGVLGIFYTNTPQHHAAGQGIFTYGLEAHTPLTKRYLTLKHTLDPYVSFQGYTTPTSQLGHHFIFNLYDGYTRLNLARVGVKQRFYSLKKPQLLPQFSWDLFTYGFIGKTAFHRVFPKVYTLFEIARPSFCIGTGVAYNLQEELWDYANVKVDWTINADVALGVEFRHRSRYAWRKADPDNFMLEAARPISELLHSPLSDGRDTLLTRAQVRFSPLWTAHLESHHGWGRRNEPRYNTFTARVAALITGGWQLEFGLSYDPEKKWEGVTPAFRLMR